MIECDRCKKEISVGECLTECIDSIHYDQDYTEITSNGNVWRFCEKCWDEVIDYLLSNGQLGSPI